MRTVIFTPAAQFEMIHAQAWYEKQSPGLGSRFRSYVDMAVEELRAHPLHSLVVYRHVRRALLKRFPYALLFVLDADESITVIACFHGSRNPMRWRRRA